MLTNLNELNLEDASAPLTVHDAEQDLLFIGLHSSTGRLMVQFVEGEEAVSVEIANPVLRTKMLSLLIDGVGEALERVRGEEAAQA